MTSKLDHSPVDIHADVKLFFDTAQPEMLQKPGQPPDRKVVELAIKLIEEEVVKELLVNLVRLRSTYSPELMALVLDDIVDSIYVIQWTTIALNLPFNAAWKAVQSANMAKFPIHKACNGKGCDWQDAGQLNGTGPFVAVQCTNGRVVTRNPQTGKVMKPENWHEAPIFQLLHDHWSELVEAEHPEILKY